MKTKFFSAFVVLMLVATLSQAQDYNKAIGLRFGYPNAISGKMFINDNAALEGILGFRSFSSTSYISITALYQIHKPIGSVDGLSWFYGGGANLYLYSFKSSFSGDKSSNLAIGIAGSLGLDYKFDGIPVNLSLDWLPIFSLTGYDNGFVGDSFALTARYVLD